MRGQAEPIESNKTAKLVLVDVRRSTLLLRWRRVQQMAPKRLFFVLRLPDACHNSKDLVTVAALTALQYAYLWNETFPTYGIFTIPACKNVLAVALHHFTCAARATFFRLRVPVGFQLTFTSTSTLYNNNAQIIVVKTP